jgi:NTP pyrophosphatase (non-canonical NTP hydrolase)
MDLADFQRSALGTDQAVAGSGQTDLRLPQRHEVIPILGLVGEVGALVGEYKKLLRDGSTHRNFRDEVAEELGDILWYVANLASKFELNLNDVASQNLKKVRDRWGATSVSILFDESMPPDQQLPRSFAYRFDERVTAGGTRQLVLVDVGTGCQIGDPLTDNSYDDDGYRFHDVMHLAFAATLGWSPVLRKLLRKSALIQNRQPATVADVEDGGRAQVIEEAIVAAAYAYASKHAFLDGVEAVDWALLRHVRDLTNDLEIKDCTTGQWNSAILRGFSVWRLIRANCGGIVKGDLTTRSIEFAPA